MLCVKTTVKPSSIAGLGLYADEFIPKGTIVWKFEPKLDVLLSKEDIDRMQDAAKKQIYNYAYFDKKYNCYLLCGDDARFFNHSNDCNCDDSNEDYTVAKWDINQGDELTVNYVSFYGNAEEISFLKNQ